MRGEAFLVSFWLAEIYKPPIHTITCTLGTSHKLLFHDDEESSFREPKSTFKNALQKIRVPQELLEGVHVLRVFANGKTQKSFLTLSPDKFTLYLTTERKTTAIFSIFGRNKPTTVQERAIDIGAIDRIQRGHGTKRFEMAKYVHVIIIIYILYWTAYFHSIVCPTTGTHYSPQSCTDLWPPIPYFPSTERADKKVSNPC